MCVNAFKLSLGAKEHTERWVKKHNVVFCLLSPLCYLHMCFSFFFFSINKHFFFFFHLFPLRLRVAEIVAYDEFPFFFSVLSEVERKKKVVYSLVNFFPLCFQSHFITSSFFFFDFKPLFFSFFFICV